MQKLVIFVAIVACGCAAPVENSPEVFPTARLVRPSPINPDIPSDPKPEEKVVLISTEKPVDSEQPVIVPLGPYALPSQPKQLSKREEKQPSKPVSKDSSSSSSSEEDSSEEDKKPSTILKPISSASPSTSAPPIQSSEAAVDHSTGTPSSTTASRVPYSPKIHQHNEHLFKPTTEAASTALSSSPALKQTADVPAVASNDHVNDKRDIPVVSPQKVESEAVKQSSSTEEVKKDEDHKPQQTPSTHPATISRPIPVAELFAKKPATE